MGQGDSKDAKGSPLPSSFSRKESIRSINGSTGSSTSSLRSSGSRRSVQLTEKEKKKLQQLQQKAEAKRSRQIKELEKEEIHETKKSGRERAATKIQAAMRGTIGRRKFMKFKEERERKAATKIQAFVRGWIGRRNYKNLKGRTIVAKELHTTERDYITFLSAIIKYYIRPLRLMDENDHPLLTNDEMKVIFNQVEVIHSYNMQFLVALEYNIGKKWSYVQTVGDIFMTYVEFFRAPYKQFIMKYSEASAMLDICIKRSGVDAFFQKCKKQQECGNRDIRSLLSMPFQRIPRYILLLKEILKYTRRDHDDFMYICQALQKMEDLAVSANEQLRNFELTNAVLDISKSFEPPIQNLVNPYRKFRRDGELKCKKEHSNEKFYDATVFLFNDCVIAAVKMASKNITKFRPKLVVNLKNCVVLDCKDSDGAEEGEKRLTDSWEMSAPGDIVLTDPGERAPTKQMFEFRIHSLTESVIFRAASQESKDLWMSHIITEVNLLTESKLTSHPLWRSKASYGVNSLRKRTLQKNRTLSQAKLDHLPRKDSNRKDGTTRKDSEAKKQGSPVAPRRDSTSSSPPAPRRDSGPPVARRDSSPPEVVPIPAPNVEAQIHAKHIAELANLVATKQRTKSIASGIEGTGGPTPDPQVLIAKEEPVKLPSKTPRSSMVALPGLGQAQKLRPIPPPRGDRKAIIIDKSPLSTELTVDAPSQKSTTTGGEVTKTHSKPHYELSPATPEPRTESTTSDPITELTTEPLTERTIEPSEDPTEALEAPTEDYGDEQLSAIDSSTEIFPEISNEPYLRLSQDSEFTAVDSRKMARMSLAASLGLNLVPDVDAGLIKLSEGIVEPPKQEQEQLESTTEESAIEETTTEEIQESIDSELLADSSTSLSTTDSPSSLPSTPKPKARSNTDGMRASRPVLPSSTNSNTFSPILLSPITSPAREFDRSSSVFPRPRKVSRAPPLRLDNQPQSPPSKESPPSTLSSSPSSVVSPRWPPLFDSPKQRAASPSERASPMLGNMGKRLTLINARQPSEENVTMSPAPQRSPSQGITTSAFLSQVRAGRIARMSKYEKFDSNGGLRRDPSVSESDSEDNQSSSFLWRHSMNSSNASQALSLASLPMPRSVSSDAILYLPLPPHPPPSTSPSTENGEVVDYFDTTTGELWDSDIVDNEVIEIFSSRFRSFSFSCVEDLLEYGFEVDAQI